MRNAKKIDVVILANSIKYVYSPQSHSNYFLLYDAYVRDS